MQGAWTPPLPHGLGWRSCWGLCPGLAAPTHSPGVTAVLDGVEEPQHVHAKQWPLLGPGWGPVSSSAFAP